MMPSDNTRTNNLSGGICFYIYKKKLVALHEMCELRFIYFYIFHYNYL